MFGLMGVARMSGQPGGGFSPLSLFAAGEQGALYEPWDFSTMFQDSAGTTSVIAVEQPVGLILDKRLGMARGAELVTNGDFSDGFTDWTPGGSWSVVGGAAQYSGAGFELLYQIQAAVNSAFISVSFTVSGTGTGDCRIGTAGTAQFSWSNSPGVKTGVFRADAGNFIAFSGSGGTFSIDNISVRAVTGAHASQSTSGERPTLQVQIARGMALPVDYWVDAATGSDADDGLTAATAWATLSKITQSLIATGETKTVRIKAGTYDDALDSLLVRLVAQTGTTFNVVFEPGCIIDGTAYASGDQNGVGYRSEAAGGGGNVFNAYGNGCTIQNVTTADGNGLDGSGEAAVANFYDFSMVNCRDGISMHEGITANFCGVSAVDCLKWAVGHVGTGVSNHYNCSFSDANATATLGGLLRTELTGGTLFQNCEFLPGTTYASTVISCFNGPAIFMNCRLGTNARKVELSPYSGGSVTIQDSFINAYWDGVSIDTTLTRCFGLLSARIGTGGAFTVTNCVITGPATGLSSVFYSGYDPGSSVPFIVRDNIFETATAAAFMDVDATNAGYLVAAGSRFRNNILSGSAAIDADLVTADTGGVVVGGNVTADALIGAANTLDPDDYGYTSSSPAIGAATAGGNCGFAVGEVAAMAAIGVGRPLVYSLSFDGVDDELETTFPDLGTDVTIARALPLVGASILTGQTIGAGTWLDSTNHAGLVIVDRALTAGETAALTAYLDTKAGV